MTVLMGVVVWTGTRIGNRMMVLPPVVKMPMAMVMRPASEIRDPVVVVAVMPVTQVMETLRVAVRAVVRMSAGTAVSVRVPMD